MTSHTISSPRAEKAESSASPLPATEEAPTLNTNAHLVEDHSNGEEQESHQPGGGKDHDAEKETASGDERENGDEAIAKDEGEIDDDEAPPLPNETLPPLPAEALPAAVPEEDDGWAPVWDQNVQAFYFYNRFTGATQWTNPRVPDPAVLAPPPGLEVPSSVAAPTPETQASRPAGGYDPAIHGDYDPTAWYAQPAESSTPPPATGSTPAEQYAATGAFNRFTGRWQAADLNPENFNDENKSKRQMNAFFDVDAAANSHDGRSLKAERSGKKLSKTELKQFKEKRKAKKEEKRRAWLLD